MSNDVGTIELVGEVADYRKALRHIKAGELDEAVAILDVIFPLSHHGKQIPWDKTWLPAADQVPDAVAMGSGPPNGHWSGKAVAAMILAMRAASINDL